MLRDMRILCCTLPLLAVLALATSADAQTSRPADVIFEHGHILTNFDLKIFSIHNPKPIYAEAVAIADGKVLAFGSDSNIARYRGPHTEVIDLGGHFAMPGFNDAHTHIAEAGLGKLEVDLTGT